MRGESGVEDGEKRREEDDVRETGGTGKNLYDLPKNGVPETCPRRETDLTKRRNKMVSIEEVKEV